MSTVFYVLVFLLVFAILHYTIFVLYNFVILNYGNNNNNNNIIIREKYHSLAILLNGPTLRLYLFPTLLLFSLWSIRVTFFGCITPQSCLRQHIQTWAIHIFIYVFSMTAFIIRHTLDIICSGSSISCLCITIWIII